MLFDLAFKGNFQTILHEIDRLVVIVDIARKTDHFIFGDSNWLIRSFKTFRSTLKLDFKEITDYIFFIWVLGKRISPRLKN